MTFLGGPQKPCQAKRPLAVVRIVFIALAAPVDGVTRVTLWAKPLLATPRALHEILVLRENGLVLPFVTHRVELCPRLRVSLKNLFTTDHIRHNRKQYSTNGGKVNTFFA